MKKALNFKILILPNLIHTLSIPIKIPESYFVDIDTLVAKFIWTVRKCRMVNTVPKKNKVEVLIQLDFNAYNTTVVPK